MVDGGDIGGLVGGVAAGGLTAKLLGVTTLTALSPAYVIGGVIGVAALAGYYIGHSAGHSLFGSGSHSPAH